MGGIKTNDTILKIFEIIKLTKYAKICILMVSSVLHIMSQVEHAKKCNSIDSESKFVKQSTDHQNYLTVCFYMLL